MGKAVWVVIFIVLFMLPTSGVAVSDESVATLEGHSLEVRSVAFSPDGRLVASGSNDGTVKLWNVSTRGYVATLEFNGPVLSVAFSPDGKLLASGSDDRTVKLWNASTRENVRMLTGHWGPVLSVAFSPDSKLLASGSYTTVKLWDMSTWKCVATLEGHSGYIYSVAFSPDGRLVASGSRDKTVKLWNVSSREYVATLEGCRSDVLSVAFSPDGKLLASGGADNTVELWDVSTKECVGTLEGHSSDVYSVAFSPDGGLLASGGDTVKLWDVSTKECVGTLEGHGGDVSSVAFSPDGNLIASGSDDRTVKLWNVYATITLSSSPSGADIYLDGSYQGTTPKTISNLDAGTYILKISKDGYDDHTQSVEVEAGETATVSVGLSLAGFLPFLQGFSYSSIDLWMLALAGVLLLSVLSLGILVNARRRRGDDEKCPKSEVPPPPPPPEEPQQASGFPSAILSRYSDPSPIGDGGFARVFRAVRKKDRKTVAVKVPLLDESTSKSFLKEVSAWSRLSHENIVRLYDADVLPVPYLEMEYCDGGNLESVQKPLSISRAVGIVRGIASGLEHAHSQGVVHRDLKPLNVLVKDWVPKISDFGLAKLAGTSKLSSVKGLSPLYAAPEQIDETSYGHPDERTDIYQLGVIFYELLTGKLPYEGHTPLELVNKIISHETTPERPSEHNPEARAYDEMVMKCLKKRKEHMFKSVSEFLSLLEGVEDKSIEMGKIREMLETQKLTLKRSTSREELSEARRMTVELLGKLALMSAQMDDKVELLNALHDLKLYTTDSTNLKELIGMIEHIEYALEQGAPLPESYAGDVKMLVHRIKREKG